MTATCELPADDLELLAAVIANVPVGVLAADAELRCAYANERLAHLTATGPGQLLDDGFVNVVVPDDRQRLHAACRVAVARRRETVETVELHTPEGAHVRVEVRLTPLTSGDGAARGVVGVVQERAQPEPSRIALEPTIGYVAYLD